VRGETRKEKNMRQYAILFACPPLGPKERLAKAIQEEEVPPDTEIHFDCKIPSGRIKAGGVRYLEKGDNLFGPARIAFLSLPRIVNTPAATPWRIVDHRDTPGYTEIMGCPYSIAGDDERWTVAHILGDGTTNRGKSLANAEFLVNAVNAHEGLLAACEKVLRIVEPLDDHERWSRAVCRILRSAIVKAKGENHA